MSEQPPEVPDDPAGLVISTAELARRAGMTVTVDNHQTFVDAILDAQADVVGYLHRAIMPADYTETGLFPIEDGWPLTPLDDPVHEVTEVIAETVPGGTEPTGYFTVKYRAGLDASSDPELAPIRRYVRVHALNQPEVVRLWTETTKTKGAVTSVSAEGQSIGYAPATLGGGGQAGSGAPGALPLLDSLFYWKRQPVFQRPTVNYPGEWPYRSLDTVPRQDY